MVARFTDRKDGRRLRRVAGAGLHRADATFQVGDPFFDDIGCRVADTGVDVARLL